MRLLHFSAVLELGYGGDFDFASLLSGTGAATDIGAEIALPVDIDAWGFDEPAAAVEPAAAEEPAKQEQPTPAPLANAAERLRAFYKQVGAQDSVTPEAEVQKLLVHYAGKGGRSVREAGEAIR